MNYDVLGTFGADLPPVEKLLPAGVDAVSEGLSRIFTLKESADLLKQALAADQTAKNALGQALYTKTPGDQAAADVAMQQMNVPGLSAEQYKKRLDAARDGVTAAQKDYQQKTADKSKVEAAKSASAYLQAAQQIATKVANLQMTSSAPSSSFSAPEGGTTPASVFAQPTSNWGLFAGLTAATLLVTTFFLLKK